MLVCSLCYYVLILVIEKQQGIVVVTNSSQSKYKLHRRWATTCTIGSSKYKNLKLKKKGKKGSRFVVFGQSYIAPYGSRGWLTDRKGPSRNDYWIS
jgi:hypothetical protein